MSAEQNEKFVRVKDGQGNEFLCPLSSLKDIREASEEDLDNCVDDGTAGRYAGNIDIVDPGQKH